jgi:TolB-like protein
MGMATRFLRELRRRHVFRVAAAYAVVGWLLIQIATQVFPFFELPNWSVRLIVLVILAGFPIALVLAWAFDATHTGIVRTEDGDLTPHRSRRAVVAVGAIGALIALLAGYGYWHWSVTAPAPSRAAAANADAIPAQGPAVATPMVHDKSIAVLPFDNLSDDKANAYFAEGMQDEILTRLAGIADLKVISRTSTKRYESHPDNLKNVANELGVANILEGSVQKAGEAVRVNVQLIDARNDAHLWAQTYDRQLKNVFAVESEVAQQIADVLKAQLSPHETRALATAPTQNASAYDQFLKAEYASHKAVDTFEEADYLAADAMYKKAIALDPGFALAYARQAYYALGRHWNLRPFTEAELAAVKASIDRAMQLAPDLPESHLALGYYYYWGYRRYDDAVAQFQRVQQLAPNNSQALAALAFIHRRRGEWEPALALFQTALQLSPRDANVIDELGLTYSLLRRYAEAEQQLSRALAIDPEDSQARDWLMIVHLFGHGDVPGARAAFDPLPGWRIAGQINAGGDALYLINPRAYLHLYERQFDAALAEWDLAPVQDNPDDRLVQRTARVAIQIIANRRDAVQAECAQIKSLLDAELAKRPDSLALLLQASWTSVCLGHNADAIAFARHATEVLPISRDAYFGMFQLSGLAEVETHAGAHDEAFKLIEQLLAMPAGGTITIERLKRDPLWDPLRKDPRFDLLLKHYEAQSKDAVHE